MGFCAADLEALDQAIASGVVTVRVGEKVVTYQSISEMLRAREMIGRALQTQAASRVTLAVLSEV